MGATKRFAELYIQSLSAAVRPSDRTMHRTRFVAVRFGNVLGSNGSVVPIFARQIAAGGPVTVTHPDMRRFFMTIPEASQLVMQAGAIGKGGEIFVLDMGEPVRILELARTMIRRQGLEPEKDIAIRFTGIRPGEKLYEELANDDEQTKPTAHPKIRVWQLGPAESRQIASQLTLLAEAAGHDREAALAALALCIPEYRPDRRHVLSARTPALRLVTPASISEIEAA
jgi:FlaA1/EpsC-like NDP-sugar epimerase